MSFPALLCTARPRLSSLPSPSSLCFLSTSASAHSAWSGRGSQSSRPKPRPLGRFNKGVYEEDSSPRQASWDGEAEERSYGGRGGEEEGYAAPVRKPARKKMPRNPPPPGPPSQEEMEKRHKMRVARAERLERMDLTSQLTPQKTCKRPARQPGSPRHRKHDR